MAMSERGKIIGSWKLNLSKIVPARAKKNNDTKSCVIE
jgi:hypothetical protein